MPLCSSGLFVHSFSVRAWRGLSEPSVLAMIVKLLEHRRTHRGDWGEFEAQLLLRSAERFAFLRASDPHHAFWRWAWNQISFF